MTLPEIKNNRYIQYDEDTVIGYDFPNQKFYVINKDTKTTRNTAEQIVSVLNALGIADYTAEDLNNTIRDTTETLGSIECTLTDDGSYVRTLQFNEWINYPLAVDCEKKNIYIRGTNVSFSLDIDDSNTKRAEEFCSYYKLRLGLAIDESMMREACGFLVDQYETPSFYNVLSKNDETNILKYTNTFKMNNFSNNASITCNGTNDPTKTFSNKQSLGQIQNIDNENDLISLKEAFLVPEEDEKFFTPGFQVSITGTTYEEDGATYTADGTYTINQTFRDSDNKIESVQVDEPITASYKYPYPTCYIKSGSHNIYSMERETNSIKVEANYFPNNLITGNKIHVENAVAGDGYGTVDMSGIYTVQNVSTQIKQISDTVLGMGTYNNKNAIVISTPMTNLKKGDTLQIKGTETADDNISYTINEEPVESISSTTLYVEEEIPYSYGLISDVSMTLTFRNDATGYYIELPEGSNIVVNPQDIINISGTSTSNDGQYTITKVIRGSNNSVTLKVNEEVTASSEVTSSVTIVSMNPVSLTSQTIMYYNIYVTEGIPTDFISTGSQQATFFKEDFVSNIVSINNDNKQITLEDNSSSELINETLYIYTNTNRYERIVESVLNDVITLNEALNEDMPNPTLYLLKPASETMLSVIEIHEELSDTVPTGDFALDTFSQCQSYIESLQNLDIEVIGETKIPSLEESVNDNMYKELKENTTIVTIGGFEVTFKGLYSEVYTS